MTYQEKQLQAERREAAKPNLTGIPTQMKLDYERSSGLSFNDVRVHYNSDRPARLGALAYTQGTQVFIGPGQEQHLPHELGHVIQQKLGLVRPTGTIAGMPLNDSVKLERAADCPPVQMKTDTQSAWADQSPVYAGDSIPVVQRLIHYSKRSGMFYTSSVRRAIKNSVFPPFSLLDRCHTVSDKSVQNYVCNFLNALLNEEADDDTVQVLKEVFTTIRGTDEDGKVDELVDCLVEWYLDYEQCGDEQFLSKMARIGTDLYDLVANSRGNLRYGIPSGNRYTGEYLDIDSPEIMDFYESDDQTVIMIRVVWNIAYLVQQCTLLGDVKIALSDYKNVGAVANSSDPKFNGKRLLCTVTEVELSTEDDPFGYIYAMLD